MKTDQHKSRIYDYLNAALTLGLLLVILTRLIWIQLRDFTPIIGQDWANFTSSPQTGGTALTHTQAQNAVFTMLEQLFDGRFALEPSILNEDLVFLSILISSCLARMLAGSWTMGLVIGGALLSRGSLVAGISHVGHEALLLCLVSMGVLATLHFVRTAFLPALGASGIIWVSASLLNPAIVWIPVWINLGLIYLFLWSRPWLISRFAAPTPANGEPQARARPLRTVESLRSILNQNHLWGKAAALLVASFLFCLLIQVWNLSSLVSSDRLGILLWFLSDSIETILVQWLSHFWQQCDPQLIVCFIAIPLVTAACHVQNRAQPFESYVVLASITTGFVFVGFTADLFHFFLEEQAWTSSTWASFLDQQMRLGPLYWFKPMLIAIGLSAAYSLLLTCLHLFGRKLAPRIISSDKMSTLLRRIGT